MTTTIFVCSFEGAIASLKPSERNELEALRCLEKNPRVSCWDLHDHHWLRKLISKLQHKGFIHNDGEEPYPWIKFTITEAGKQMLKENQSD